MATSGSTDWSATGDSIVRGAQRLLGKRDREADTTFMTEALESLNGISRAWQAKGLYLWKIRDITVFLEDDAQYYDVGPTGDEAAIEPAKTDITTAAVLGAATIVVDSVTGIATTYVIGVELDDGSIQWTTVNGAPVSTTVTLTAVTTDTVAAKNNVYAYSALPAKPVKVLSARYINSSEEERELWVASREEYMQMPDKTETGECIMVYPDMRTTDIRIYTWPTCDNVKERIVLTVRIPPDDFDASTNNADFPPEWTRALKYNLAVELAPEYEVEPSEYLLYMAKITREEVENADVEASSVTFSADTEY